MITVDFSETIAASDLKGCRNRHLIEYMKIIKVLKDVYIQKFKQNFLKNYCTDLNQIL